MAAGASALVQKLNRFLPLGGSRRAGQSCRPRGAAAPDPCAHRGRPRAPGGSPRFHPAGRLGVRVQAVAHGGRQVIDFSVPGDFMGLRSVLLRTSDHTFAAVSDIIVAEVSARQMIDAFQRLPRLGAAILWAASRDEAMVVEHLGSWPAQRARAHRPSPGRVRLRLQLVGLGSDSGFGCPLNQYLLADALGLTAIDVNRVLRQLRERGLVTFREGPWCFTTSPACAASPNITAAISTRATGSSSETRRRPARRRWLLDADPG